MSHAWRHRERSRFEAVRGESSGLSCRNEDRNRIPRFIHQNLYFEKFAKPANVPAAVFSTGATDSDEMNALGRIGIAKQH